MTTHAFTFAALLLATPAGAGAGVPASDLVVEPVAAPADAGVSGGSAQSGSSAAVPVVEDAARPAALDLTLDRFTVREVAGGGRRLWISIANGGGAGGDVRLWADVYDATGVRLGRFDGGSALLCVDCSVRGAVPLPPLAPGEYQAVVVADGGGDEVFGRQFSFVVP